MNPAHRMQAHGALLELVGLDVDALEHQPDASAALAAQTAQFETLVGELAALVAELPPYMGFDLLRTVKHYALEHLPALRQQLGGERGFEGRQAAAAQRRIVTGNARREGLARREREHALGGHAEGARGVSALRVDLRVDRRAGGERVEQRIDLVEHDKTRLALGAEVVAPDAQIGASHAGVGAEDEDGRVRRRQQAQGQLGLGADRVQARRVEHHQPLAQQRMRVVDERMAPDRHFDQAGVVDGRVVVRLLVVPEAQLARPPLRDPLGARHFLQRLGQLLGLVDVQRQRGPGAPLGTQFGQRQAVAPGFDRQRHQAGRVRRIPPQLHRAHRGAPGRGRQDAPAGVGEEDRVDQLGLAAREFCDEGNDELFMAQALAQTGQTGCRMGVGEFVFAQEAGHVIETFCQRRPPAAEGIQAGGERRRHGRGVQRMGVKKMVSHRAVVSAE